MQAARAGAVAFTLDSENDEEALRGLLEIIRPHTQSGGEAKYPYDLLWRDLGLLEWSVGRGTKASRRAFDQAHRVIEKQEASPVVDWRKYGIVLLKKGVLSPNTEPPNPPPSAGTLTEGMPTYPTARDAMQAYLRVSPY